MMIVLGALPLLVGGAAAVSRPAPSPPIAHKLVQTEGVRVVRMDIRTFRARWMPVYEMPPATEVRYLASEGEVAGTVSGAEISPPPRHRLRSRPVRLDVCARHGWHKVVTRGGKSWRCRR